MIDVALLEKTCPTYRKEQLDAIARGFCPHCHPQPVVYRILETFHSEEHGMRVHRAKCPSIVHCEWEELIPAHRSENGLDNFFHS
jgi:hypothetical protein